MIDAKGFVHVPQWLKWGALLLLVGLLVLSVLITAIYAGMDDPKDPKYADWILIGLSTAQLSLTGVAIALVLFFAEREAGTRSLQQRTEEFLTRSVPEALAQVSSTYALRVRQSDVEQLGRSDIFGAAYRLQSGGESLKVWVGINVTRLFVIFWIKADADASAADLQAQYGRMFEFTFGGAQKVGYHTFYEVAQPDGRETVVSVWSSVDTQHNLLTEPASRVFWLQDMAMMVESFWRTALRNRVQLSERDPSPL